MENELGPGGRTLWDLVTADHELDAGQRVQLLEACRVKDRLDLLDRAVRQEMDPATVKLANESANLLKQLIAALRLPDPQSGKRPQVRSARGSYGGTKPSGKVSSLDRARARKTGS